MKFIITPRGTGRTYQLIKFLRDNPKRAMIVATQKMKSDLQDAHRDVAKQIFTFYEYQATRLLGTGFEVIDFDDIDLILSQIISQISHHKIGYCTMPTDVLIGYETVTKN